VERSSSLEVELSSLNALKDIVENDPAHFSRILRACWGLVLRCYTGLDTLSFIYEDETNPNEPGLRTFVMDIHVSGSCADMLNQEEVALAVDLEDAWKNVNSAMLIHKVTGEGEVQKPRRTTVSPEVRSRHFFHRERADRLDPVLSSTTCEVSEKKLPDLLGPLDWRDILQLREEYRLHLRHSDEPNLASSRSSNRWHMPSQHARQSANNEMEWLDPGAGLPHNT